MRNHLSLGKPGGSWAVGGFSPAQNLTLGRNSTKTGGRFVGLPGSGGVERSPQDDSIIAWSGLVGRSGISPTRSPAKHDIGEISYKTKGRNGMSRYSVAVRNSSRDPEGDGIRPSPDLHE